MDEVSEDRLDRGGVWMLAVGETLVWAALFYSFAALLVDFESDLGWSKAELTFAFLVAMLASALAAPVAGRIVDGGRGAGLLLGGALGGSAALVLLSRVETPAGFTLVWALIGVAQAACLYEPCFATVTRAARGSARREITAITLVAGFASPIAFPAGAVMAAAFGWRGAVVAMALVVAVVAAPLLYSGARRIGSARRPEGPGDGARADRGAVRRALRSPAFWAIGVAFSALALEHGMIVPHVVPLLLERGFGRGEAVLAASLFGPMQVAGRLALMGYGGRAGPVALTLVPFAGVALAAAVLRMAGLDLGLVLVFAALQGASFGLVSILKPLVIVEALGRAGYGAVAGWLALPYLAGGALGPYAGALLWRRGGYDLALVAGIAMALTGLAAVAFMRRRA